MRGEPMSEERMLQDRLLDERIVRALESEPDVSEMIPSDFAARVAAQVPARKPVAVTPTHYGRRAMIFCGVVLFAVLVALTARGVEHSAIGLILEWCLFAQFVTLAIWLGTRRWGEG
jgi:hypothetical protein